MCIKVMQKLPIKEKYSQICMHFKAYSDLLYMLTYQSSTFTPPLHAHNKVQEFLQIPRSFFLVFLETGQFFVILGFELHIKVAMS